MLSEKKDEKDEKEKVVDDWGPCWTTPSVFWRPGAAPVRETVKRLEENGAKGDPEGVPAAAEGGRRDWRDGRSWPSRRTRGRNRYKDVGCWDQTRVKLRGSSGQTGDYIHGNWVDGNDVVGRYILTQGPMEDKPKLDDTDGGLLGDGVGAASVRDRDAVPGGRAGEGEVRRVLAQREGKGPDPRQLLRLPQRSRRPTHRRQYHPSLSAHPHSHRGRRRGHPRGLPLSALQLARPQVPPICRSPRRVSSPRSARSTATSATSSTSTPAAPPSSYTAPPGSGARELWSPLTSPWSSSPDPSPPSTSPISSASSATFVASLSRHPFSTYASTRPSWSPSSGLRRSPSSISPNSNKEVSALA